jgi:hypothetical protein
MTGKTFVSGLQIKQRAAFNVAFSDGTELTINDDDNVQGLDPGTGRSVDVGGCGWTLYNAAAEKVAEGRDGLLAYSNNFPYTGLVFEAPGRIKVVQDGPARGPDNGYYEIRFTAISL